MKIYRMAASFGKLSNAKIELGENLNIVQAPNEAGKSTWCAFIRTMLYGINTSDRDKTGYISDKNRYQPFELFQARHNSPNQGVCLHNSLGCLLGQ